MLYKNTLECSLPSCSPRMLKRACLASGPATPTCRPRAALDFLRPWSHLSYLFSLLLLCHFVLVDSIGSDDGDDSGGKHSLWFFGFSVLLLWWNEGHLVRRLAALDETRKRVRPHQYDLPLDPSLDGELLHMCGSLVIHDYIEDEDFGCRVNQRAQLQRKVEIYQWTETKRTTKKKTRYSYTQKWVGKPVDSSRFQIKSGHVNKHGGWDFDTHGDQQLCTKNATFGYVVVACFKCRMMRSKTQSLCVAPTDFLLLCCGIACHVTGRSRQITSTPTS